LNMKELSILKIYKNGLLNRLNNKILKLYLSLMDKKLSINSVPNLMELVSFLSYQKLLLLAMNSKEKIISQWFKKLKTISLLNLSLSFGLKKVNKPIYKKDLT
jgi:hypothetical protein